MTEGGSSKPKPKRAAPAWVLFYEQQADYDKQCEAGEMRCSPVELFGARFFAYQETPKPKGKEN